MSDASGSRQTVSVVCEKHGLRYNPTLHSGCVRCRKEAGEKIGAPAPVARTAAPAAAAAAEGSVLPALAVTLLLVVVTGGGFYFAHRQIRDTVGGYLSQEGAGGYDDAGYFDDEEPDFPDEMELTPEEREQLEGLRDELEKSMRESSDG